MSVYVDQLLDHGWKLGRSCHMFADTLDELHAMAKSIGLKRDWFQPAIARSEWKPFGRVAHYDLTARRRMAALAEGAISLDRRQTVAKWDEIMGVRK